MASWPSNWKAQALQAADIPVTPAALKVMSAWQRSTPLQPWSSNPIGMPVTSNTQATVPTTRYALFPSMMAFYGAFNKFSFTTDGKALANAIMSDSPYAPAWRIISNLNWPGSKTETDYPSVLLDLTTEDYRQSVKAANSNSRKSAGLPHAHPDVHAVMRQQAQAITDAAAAFTDARVATRYLIRRHASNG